MREHVNIHIEIWNDNAIMLLRQEKNRETFRLNLNNIFMKIMSANLQNAYMGDP